MRDKTIEAILSRVAANGAVSQRTVSRDLGIALGLTNRLLRHMARKGWIRVIPAEGNRVTYLITASGRAKRDRASRMRFLEWLRMYREARDRIDARLEPIASASRNGSGRKSPPRVVLYGAGEAAEISYFCARERNLHVVAIVDNERTAPFFGVPVHAPDQLRAHEVAGKPFDCLIVTSVMEGHSGRRARLRIAAVPRDRICWL